MTKVAEKYWKPLLCSVLIIIGTSAALIAWRELHEYKLPNGGMYSEAVPYYALNDAVLMKNRAIPVYCICFPKAGGEADARFDQS